MADPSLTEILPRLFISMAVVIVVMYIAARVLQSRRGGVPVRRTPGKPVKAATRTPMVQVLGRSGLGKGSAVSVVRAGDKTLVLGVTATNVTLLAELDEEIVLDDVADSLSAQVPLDQALNVGSPQAWTGLLAQVRERTVRK